jgi:DNA-binding NtrC family response regulator
MSQGTILFVAEPQSVTDIFPRIKEAGHDVTLAENLSGAQNVIKKSPPLVIFSKTRLPGYRVESLLGVAAEAMGEFPPIVAFTDAGSAEEARKLMELGAADYWLEPLVWDKIRAAIPGEARPEVKAPKAEALAKGGPEIIGKHPSMLKVMALAKQVAPSRATVLISGASGTGKEKIARFLHSHSGRTNAPFVAINCAALPEHLLESELFGHEKGSFTGAISRKLGKFELATGGTILLDEISEMDLGLQAKLLRVLQENEVDRVGGVETVKVDVRVLATTNRKLDEYVAEGRFRQDLYYRLNVIPLRLPALSERGEDVVLLARYFVGNFCEQYGLGRLDFSPEARQWLLEYDWPGNVRELQNLMERAVLLAGNGPIQTRHFLIDSEEWEGPDNLEEVSAQAESGAQGPQGEQYEGVIGEVMPIEEMEKRMIIKSLEETAGNRTQAANLLGISVRTLRNKLNEYRKQGLDV